MKTEKEQLLADIKAILERIEKLDNPTKQYKEGNWLYGKGTGYDFVIKYKRTEGDKMWYSLAKFSDGVYKENDYVRAEFIKRPATHSEIQEALIAEAKRRGFKEGVRITKPEEWGYISPDTIGKSGFNYRDGMLGLGTCMLFKDGQWATIISEPKIEIGGKEVVIDGKFAKIGCKSFSKAEIIPIYDFMVTFGFSEVSFDGFKTDRKAINQILTKL